MFQALFVSLASCLPVLSIVLGVSNSAFLIWTLAQTCYLLPPIIGSPFSFPRFRGDLLSFFVEKLQKGQGLRGLWQEPSGELTGARAELGEGVGEVDRTDTTERTSATPATYGPFSHPRNLL